MACMTLHQWSQYRQLQVTEASVLLSSWLLHKLFSGNWTFAIIVQPTWETECLWWGPIFMSTRNWLINKAWRDNMRVTEPPLYHTWLVVYIHRGGWVQGENSLMSWLAGWTLPHQDHDHVPWNISHGTWSWMLTLTALKLIAYVTNLMIV